MKKQKTTKSAVSTTKTQKTKEETQKRPVSFTELVLVGTTALLVLGSIFEELQERINSKEKKGEENVTKEKGKKK